MGFMQLGDKIRMQRQKKRIKQKELATRINVDFSTMCKYESDKRKPSIDRLNQIAKILECPIGYFFDYNFDDTEIN
jgi:transcriptional regulator with XRE-family HTH domain